MAVTLRTTKGIPLTYDELDGNFIDLDSRLNAIEVANVVSVNGLTGAVTLSTTNIGEGTNLYYTDSRVDTRLATKTTTNIAEGTNLYLTAARVRANISAGTGLTYSSSTGVMTLAATTTNVTEGTNLYYTNTRADDRIAAATLDDISDVGYPVAPNNGEVLTWNSLSGAWEPALAPGAAGGETNTGSNIGTGTGIFAGKVGADLRFYTLAAGAGLSISAPVSNVITLGTTQDLSSTGTPTFDTLILTTSANIGNTRITNNAITSTTTNANLSISGNGTGYVVVDSAAGLAISSGNLIAPDIRTLSNANLNLTPNGTGEVVASSLSVTDLTSTRVIYAGTAGALVDSANLTFSGTTLTITGNANATTVNATTVNATTANLTTLNASNIRITTNVISSTDTNGNITLTPDGTGNVIVSSATATRLFYAGSNKELTTNANLTFSGTVLTVAGSANATTVNATTVNAGNMQTSGNTVASTDTNGNINITPNGTGRVGVNTATPNYLLHVNGTFGANSAVTSGSMSVGNSLTVGTTATTDTVTLNARMVSTITPGTTNSYDLGTTALKFRSLYLGSNMSVDGNTTLGDSTSDTLTLNATVSTIITPTANNTYDLGTTSLRWRDLFLSRDLSLSGDITFGGGDIISSATTANIVNTTATSVNFAGAATTLTAGATTGTAIIRNPTVVFATATSSATPAAATLKGQDGSGTNIVGANLVVQSGAGTGTGDGGQILLQYAPAGTTGTATNAYVTKVAVNANVNVTANVLPTANATYNLGSTSLRWSSVYGVSTSALYADLAERYEADANYDEGTVVVFGGTKEITVSGVWADTAVAGVISTKPAYLMNDEGQDPAKYPAVALRGKVPVKVIGRVFKGDLLVVADDAPGFAESVGKADHGASVFAKSLENKDTEEAGMIIAVIV